MKRLAASLAVFAALASPGHSQVSLWNHQTTVPAHSAPAQAAAAGAADPKPAVPANDHPAAGAPSYAGAGAVAGSTAPSVALQTPSVNLAHEVQTREFNIHDILYIIVSISAQASTGEQTDAERKTDPNALVIQNYMRLTAENGQLGLKGVPADDLALAMKSDRKTQNGGANDRSDTLRTRIAAEVTDIKPNGNLVIEARQRFSKQRETTTITLMGTIRPQDVGPDNLIYSYNVADAAINYDSAGPITDASRRGWLTKFLDKIWPF